MASIITASTIERQSPSTQLELDGFIHDVLVGTRIERELHPIHLEQLLVLLDDGVLWFNEDAKECIPVERLQVGEDGEATDDLGD